MSLDPGLCYQLGHARLDVLTGEEVGDRERRDGAATGTFDTCVITIARA